MNRPINIAAGVVLGLAISLPTMAAGPQHSPRMAETMDYFFNGAYMAEPPTSVHTVPILELGVGWDLNMGCGTFDPSITAGNQLNGLTEGFKQMMDNVIQAATAAVAGLPAMAIQRADPGLYEMLQQGILQAKMDFEWAETSCEQMANVMMGKEEFPWENYKLNAKVGEWSTSINASGGDAVSAKKAATDQMDGNAGTDWVCNIAKGGTGQPPIRSIYDTALVGYNILFDRANSCDGASVPAAAGVGTPLWEYWSDPDFAAAYVVDVVGEREVRTCNNCTKVRGEAGKGLTYKYQLTRNSIRTDLTNLVNGVTLMNWGNLNRVSAPPGVTISQPIIDSIRNRPVAAQANMINKLSGEVAYARTIEQGRLSTLLLQTGMGEPNVSTKPDAVKAIQNAVNQLELEMNQLEREVKVRQYIVSNTINKILGMEEKSIQQTRPISRGDATVVTPTGQP